MDYLMNTAGAETPVIKEYDTSAASDIKKGAVMTVANGKACEVGSGSTVILGVLAEDYKTAADDLNPRSGSGRVRVSVSPSAVYEEDAIKITAGASCTATKITFSSESAPTTSNIFKGGKAVLVSKAQNSTNTDAVGTVRSVTASASGYLTVESGGTASVGDVYALLLPAGYNCLAYDSTTRTYLLNTTSDTKVVVVGNDEKRLKNQICFCTTLFR